MSILTHELRNVLSPMRNALQLLRMRGASDGASKSAIDILDRQINNMVRMLEAVSDAERLNRAELTLDRKPVDLAEVIDAALAPTKPLIERKRQRVHLGVPPVRVLLDADAARLAQALRQLIDNAVSHTPEEGDLWIEAAARGDAIEVLVRDSGPGIPPERVPALFQFYAPREGRAGLGLGLATARALVELHGGRVTVAHSEVGSGTTLLVHLPLTESARRSSSGGAESQSTQESLSGAQAAETRPAEIQPESANGKLRRILIADDSPAVRASLSSVLLEMGHEVRDAADGAEAIDMAREWKPHYVLLDVNMPRVDGLAAARKLRGEFPPGTMRLVMMSGDGINAATVRAAKEAGFDHCVDKVLDFAALESLLHE